MAEAFITSIDVHWFCTCGKYNLSPITRYDATEIKKPPNLIAIIPICSACKKETFPQEWFELIEKSIQGLTT